MVRGFTLIELSIVLIIIGLLVGGVLAGRDLIRQAELRGISQQFQSFQTALNAFQLKYGDGLWPGDWDSAADYFSGAGEGDGNGRVLSGSDEVWLFWNHLGLAGLVDGSYTGAAGSIGVLHAVPGVNAPEATIAGGTWGVRYLNNVAASSTFRGIYPNHVQFGVPNTAGGGFTSVGIINGAESRQVDLKIDDGLPARGVVISYYDNDCTDAANVSDYDAEYDLSVTDNDCTLMMVLQDQFIPNS